MPHKTEPARGSTQDKAISPLPRSRTQGQPDKARLGVRTDATRTPDYSSVESAKGQQVSDPIWSQTPSPAHRAPTRVDHHETRPSPPGPFLPRGTPTTPHGYPTQ